MCQPIKILSSLLSGSACGLAVQSIVSFGRVVGGVFFTGLGGTRHITLPEFLLTGSTNAGRDRGGAPTSIIIFYVQIVVIFLSFVPLILRWFPACCSRYAARLQHITVFSGSDRLQTLLRVNVASATVTFRVAIRNDHLCINLLMGSIDFECS